MKQQLERLIYATAWNSSDRKNRQGTCLGALESIRPVYTENPLRLFNASESQVLKHA
jgi:hypothetical protein